MANKTTRLSGLDRGGSIPELECTVMATSMVARTLTPEIITAASTLVRIANPQDRSLRNALAKAEGLLLAQPWTVEHGILMIASESCPAECRYTDGDTCDCKTNARYWCWHRAAFVVLSTIAAAGINPTAPIPLPSVLDEDDLPGSFLDGPFDSFDDDELTATHDEYGDIIPAPAPAFIEVDSMPMLTKRRPAPFRLQPSRELVNPLDAEMDRMFAA